LDFNLGANDFAYKSRNIFRLENKIKTTVIFIETEGENFFGNVNDVRGIRDKCKLGRVSPRKNAEKTFFHLYTRV